MKIAIAGAGDLSHYFYEEFLLHGHETIALTRSRKSFLDAKGIEQRITDYSVDSLVRNLNDCDAVISTISAEGVLHVDAHLAILKACTLSTRCKRMIPSEWTTNVEDFPNQPVFSFETRDPIRRALKSQNEVQWTIVCNGWFMEYVLDPRQRYLSDIGDAWPMNHATKTFTVYGYGEKSVTMTTARDTARAMAQLVEHPSWEAYTHLSGDTMTWLDLFKIISTRDPAWKAQSRSLADTLTKVFQSGEGTANATASLQLMSYMDCNAVRGDKAQDQRDRYFSNFHWRTVCELLDEATINPHDIL